MAILEMKHISKRFAQTLANDDVSLSAEKGEIHALLGENGAGKTTLMNILFGLYQADSGEIWWKGRPVHYAAPRQAIADGIEMVHQHFSLVMKMTVAQNIILGLPQKGLFIDYKQVERDIRALSERYGLLVDPRATVRDLSVGQQQRVEILKALYRKAELLILDEPTGVLTPQETAHLFDILRALKKEGYAIIIITHRMSEILAVSDRITILRDGKKVACLQTAQTNPQELSHYMIGRELKETFELPPVEGEKAELLRLRGVSLQKQKEKPLLDGVDLTLYGGEIVGIAGVDGNGQKELAEVICGIRKQTGGSVFFKGQDIGACGIRKRFEAGISYVSDDRQQDSLVMDMTVGENLALRNFRTPPQSHHGILSFGRIDSMADDEITRYHIKTPNSHTAARLLSGGNQQKVILAREIDAAPDLIVASQPTRGLDIGATESIRELLIGQRNAGRCVLLISADLEEILAISDRICVMYDGRLVGELSREEATPEKLGLMMGGQKEVGA